MIISAFALSCSLLDFSTTFALSIPSHASARLGNCGLGSSQQRLSIALVQDLLARMWLLDSEVSLPLLRLLKIYQNSDICLLLESQSQAADFSFEGRVIAKLCRYSVLGIVGLQNESNSLCSAEDPTQKHHAGLQLLLNIISKWVQIPFRCTSHFFQLRPYVSLELFLVNEDGENIDGRSILSEGEMKEQLSLSKNQQIDDSVDLNEKLLGIHQKLTNMYICFHPNSNYQGFSTCLLGISAFPVGVYHIKWHSLKDKTMAQNITTSFRLHFCICTRWFLSQGFNSNLPLTEEDRLVTSLDY
ncbi:hypothetical protein M9H77_16469 [Catharanthus roseus]|uniref:Uncharacterized protein n=1 Tax=Catharanthus roseus TaxID=4058 RepID=A0ACC0B1V2_CATRO|nr:hypothetical protein M9H77_16469 [Catharanthus roseus]